MLGDHGQAVGADLVGHVAVRRDPVGAHEDDVRRIGREEGRGHVVGDHRDVHPCLAELPCRDAAPLEQRPGLVGVDADLLPLLGGHVDRSQRRADPSGGQRPRVAVGDDGAPVPEQLGGVLPDPSAHPPVFFQDVVRLGAQPVGQLGGG